MSIKWDHIVVKCSVGVCVCMCMYACIGKNIPNVKSYFKSLYKIIFASNIGNILWYDE